MEPHYYFIFEMHMGGCGGYEISIIPKGQSKKDNPEKLAT
jgi:hypothetical protein